MLVNKEAVKAVNIEQCVASRPTWWGPARGPWSPSLARGGCGRAPASAGFIDGRQGDASETLPQTNSVLVQWST